MGTAADRSYACRVLGAGLVMAAAMLGACSNGVSSSPTTTSTSTSSTTSSTSTSTTTSTTLPPTTTTEPLIVTGAVVKVANASGVGGAATLLTSQLTKKGFTVRDPTNALGAYSKLKTSVIFVLPGGDDVGHSVSRLMGGVAIRTMTIPAWITDGTVGLGDATVLVMIGNDRANRKLVNL